MSISNYKINKRDYDIIINMQDVYEKFEFIKIAEKLATFTKTQGGKNKALSLRMFDNSIALERELSFLSEMMSVLDRFGNLPIQVSSDLEYAITLAKKGGCLNPTDLERVASDIILQGSIKRFFNQVNESPLLLDYISHFPNISYIEQSIHRVIAPDLSIFDNASATLQTIRHAIRHLEAQMKKKLHSILESNKEYLSDVTLTLKNGHYVLPVANAHKSKVKGIVQDVSNSGGTTFIEPAVLVELNNKMVELQNDEREEIHRLLMSLTWEVLSHEAEVLESNRMIAYLDFLMAKANFAHETEAHVAILSKKPIVDIMNARHPLLDPAKVVANDFSLNEKTSLIVISGPNAGGKTVALKTLGLMVMMNQSGLAVPCDQGATLGFFKHIYVDIGDSQSLSDNLSTFSGHMRNVSQILNDVGGKDLVLLDELGTGTSPKEGEALAFAVISYLLEKHALTLVSSHFEGLKAYALSHKEVTNASMMFDEETLRPTYKLKMGIPGESFGLIVAKRFGIPEKVLDKANGYLGEHEDLSVSEAIKKLSEEARLAEEEKNKLAQERAKLERHEKELKSKEISLAKREENFLADVEKKKNDLLEGYEKQMNEILRSVQHPDAKPHEVIKAKKKLEDLQDEVRTETFDGPLSVGDYVALPSLYCQGRLTAMDGNKITVVTKEGMTLHAKKNQAVRVEEPKVEKKEVKYIRIDDVTKRASIPLELNIIGQHIEEAKLSLSKYIDECLIRRYKRVRIIHGWGSGALRNLVRSYCDSHKDFIASYEGATGEEGGGGATIVHLK